LNREKRKIREIGKQHNGGTKCKTFPKAKPFRNLRFVVLPYELRNRGWADWQSAIQQAGSLRYGLFVRAVTGDFDA